MGRARRSRSAWRLSLWVFGHVLVVSWIGYLVAVRRGYWYLTAEEDSCDCSSSNQNASLCLAHGLTPAVYGQILRRAEQSYRENLRRRKITYGKDPFAAVGRLSNHIPDGLRQEKHPAAAILELFAPPYPCFPAERFGAWNGAGKLICRPQRLTPASTVYSIRLQRLDDSFELELYNRTRAQIHVLTLQARATEDRIQAGDLQSLPYSLHRLQIVKSSNDSQADFSQLHETMASAGDTAISVLNLDCGGCEYNVLPALLQARARAPFAQVSVRLYDTEKKGSLARFLLSMERREYRLFHLEPKWPTARTLDLSYIHES